MSVQGPTESRRVTVDGTTYELRPFSYQDGRRWLYRIFKIASSSGVDVTAGKLSRFAGVVDELREEDFEQLVETCQKYTDVIDGGKVIPLDTIASVHLQGRYVALGVIIRGHLQKEYGDFFGRVREVLGLPTKEPADAKGGSE